jgi:heme A synthase
VKEEQNYRWYVFAWAVLTAVTVFPLIALGGVVTSLGIGMADVEPVRSPWYLLATLWSDNHEGLGVAAIIEHSHRTAGWLVGVFAIVLAMMLLLADSRRSLKVLGLITLIAICVQGLLGIFRVGLESAGLGLEMAMVHGVVGPVTFALLVGIAVMTSASWQRPEKVEVEDAARFRRVSRLTLLLVLLQLITGVWLRQVGQDAGFLPLFVHLFFALAVVAHVMMLWVRVGRWRGAPRLVARPVMLALILMGLQVLLGMAAWVYGGGVGARNKAMAPVGKELAIAATTHMALGSLLLAASVLVALRAARHLAAVPLTTGHSIAQTTATGGGA